MKFNLTHAKMDRAHCGRGLFRCLRKGTRANTNLNVSYELSGRNIRFVGPWALSDDDLRVMQALVAMSGPHGLILSAKPKTNLGKQLRLSLFDPPSTQEIEESQQDALVVKVSFKRLAEEIGLSGGGASFRSIRASIERLFTVSIFVESEGRKEGYRLLSRYTSDEVEGRIMVALNPLCAQAVLGGPHVRIEMSEVRLLKTGTARIIHHRLCSWVDPGKRRRVGLKSICEYAWPEDPIDPNSSSMRMRRLRARNSLKEIAKLPGWEVYEYARGKFEIRRPLNTEIPEKKGYGVEYQ